MEPNLKKRIFKAFNWSSIAKICSHSKTVQFNNSLQRWQIRILLLYEGSSSTNEMHHLFYSLEKKRSELAVHWWLPFYFEEARPSQPKNWNEKKKLGQQSCNTTEKTRHLHALILDATLDALVIICLGGGYIHTYRELLLLRLL